MRRNLPAHFFAVRYAHLTAVRFLALILWKPFAARKVAPAPVSALQEDILDSQRATLAPRVAFAVIALHVFRRSTVLASVEVNRHKRDSCSGKFVAFCQKRSFGRCLLWFQGLVTVLRCISHRMILSIRNIEMNSGVLCASGCFR